MQRSKFSTLCYEHLTLVRPFSRRKLACKNVVTQSTVQLVVILCLSSSERWLEQSCFSSFKQRYYFAACALWLAIALLIPYACKLRGNLAHDARVDHTCVLFFSLANAIGGPTRSPSLNVSTIERKKASNHWDCSPRASDDLIDRRSSIDPKSVTK